MSKTPAQIDLRLHAVTHRYYDGKRFANDAAVDAALARGRAYWFICYFGMDELDETEEDVVAVGRDEASAVIRAAIARDFVEGCKLGKVVLA